MCLITDRLTLKTLTWDDLEDVHALNSYPEVDKFNTLGIPEDLDTTREIIRGMMESHRSRESYVWSIRLKHDDTFIGEAGMGLSVKRYKRAELFYNLLPAYWGKGFATETVKRLVRFGFEDLKLHRIEAGVATENVRSIRVLEKAGMLREGMRRKILPIRGEWKDNYHYAILEEDSRNY